MSNFSSGSAAWNLYIAIFTFMVYSFTIQIQLKKFSLGSSAWNLSIEIFGFKIFSFPILGSCLKTLAWDLQSGIFIFGIFSFGIFSFETFSFGLLSSVFFVFFLKAENFGLRSQIGISILGSRVFGSLALKFSLDPQFEICGFRISSFRSFGFILITLAWDLYLQTFGFRMLSFGIFSFGICSVECFFCFCLVYDLQLRIAL